MTAPVASSSVRVGARLAGFLPRYYYGGGLVWVAYFTLPLATGLLLQALFDRITGSQAAGAGAALWLCAALVAVEVVRQVLFLAMVTLWPYWWNAVGTLVRANVLRSVLTAPGPAAGRLPDSPGEAVGRFRDDTEDLVIMSDSWIDSAGAGLFAVGALAIMASIDPVITLVVALPIVAAIVATYALGDLIRRWHRAARESGAQVTAFVGDVFASVLTLKTAGAERAALDRFRQRNRARRDAAVRARLSSDLLDTVTSSTTEIAIGLVLLLAAPALRRGEFTVGDLALFTSYAGWIAMFPRMTGRALYRLRQGSVAVERLSRLLASGEDQQELATHRPVWFREPAPPAPPPRAAAALERLEVCDLTVHVPGTTRGVHGVSLTIERGSFTVLTGAVGSGKTTFVRGLLGLLPRSDGEILWNGERVDDPGAVLVPPRVAYVGQVPRLLSGSLGENVTLGWPSPPAEVEAALRLAAFDGDVAAMAHGLETVVGARGVRLSGGQVQRATAARALVRRPDLLVVDDLSSALDVETEEELWSRLAVGGPSTMLVVSHRPNMLRRADCVVVLVDGRIARA